LTDSAIATGVDVVLKKCTKPILLSLQNTATENAAGWNKIKLVGNLGKSIEKKGFASFLEGKDKVILKKIAVKNRLVEEEQTAESVELIELIMQEVYKRGTLKIFECFSNYALKRFCDETQIEVESTSKKRLINALISGSDTAPPASTFRGIKKKSDVEKPALEAGISWLDIYNSYTLEDLRKFFKEHDTTPVKGDKSKQVDKAFEMLNPDETPTKFEEYAPSEESDSADGALEEEQSSDVDFVPDASSSKKKSPKITTKKRKRNTDKKEKENDTKRKRKKPNK
jgi:hypothetical protein